VPYPSEAFGILSAPFQWIELLESETLVFTSTRKLEVLENQRYQKTKKPEPIPEVPVQIYASSVSRGKIWIFRNLTAPAYSPQLSASNPWIRISKFEV
jgi:hypothetical protein